VSYNPRHRLNPATEMRNENIEAESVKDEMPPCEPLM
jgi:hypothetical protein